MEQITIQVKEGEYKSAKIVRREGMIPMICYANQVEPRQFRVDYQNFRRAYLKAGKSSIITLDVEGGDEQAVLVQAVQYDPVSDDMIHVDLMAIKKGQKITTDVPIVFVGESKAVKEDGGTFMSNKDKIHIECLPKDLLHEIEVDISSLVDFHTSLTVGDIKVPDNITILDAEDISIATVSAPREEEEEVVVAPVEGEGETPTEGGETPTEGEKKEGASE